MRTYRVAGVEANNRRRSFAVTIAGRAYEVPYGLAETEGPIESVAPDPEAANEAFTWRTRAGREGTMLAEQVLWIHEDPEVRTRHQLYELTLEARRRQEALGVPVRALARMLRTSHARILQLLDPTCYEKSVKQMSALLGTLGARVEITVRDRYPPDAPSTGR